MDAPSASPQRRTSRPPPAPWWPPRGMPFEVVAPCPTPPPPRDAYVSARASELLNTCPGGPWAQGWQAWPAAGFHAPYGFASGAWGRGGQSAWPGQAAWAWPGGMGHGWGGAQGTPVGKGMPASKERPASKGAARTARGGDLRGERSREAKGGGTQPGHAESASRVLFSVTREELMGEMEGMPEDWDPMAGAGEVLPEEWELSEEWAMRFEATAKQRERQLGKGRVQALRNILRKRHQESGEPSA